MSLQILETAKVQESGPKIPDELNHRPMPFWKRLFDIVVSSLMILVLSPVLLAIAIYIRMVSKGPVTFCQSRLGEMGKNFTIFKFRTMHVRPEATEEHRRYVAQLSGTDEAASKPEIADRLIPGGEFLRGHGIDELPQLFNVLFGSMSLVGPRPEVLDWDDYPPWQRRRFEATPGITGLWQVSGKNKLSFNQMIQLDLDYVQNRSLRLDCEILVRTVRVVLGRDV